MTGSFMIEIKKLYIGVIFIWTGDDGKECGDMRRIESGMTVDLVAYWVGVHFKWKSVYECDESALCGYCGRIHEDGSVTSPIFLGMGVRK